MKSLRMSIKELLEKKMPINIEELDGLLLLVVLKSLLIHSYVQWKLLKLECKHLNQEHLQQVVLLLSIKLKQMKESMVYIKVQDHYGQDKFHIPLLNLLHSNKQSLYSMKMFSLNQKIHIQKLHNYQLHLLLVIQLVSFVLLFHIQLIQLYLN